MRVIADPQMRRTFHKHNCQFYKCIFDLQMKNSIFTSTHLFAKTKMQVTNIKFTFVDIKTHVQTTDYL